jgi:hypothetical protein
VEGAAKGSPHKHFLRKAVGTSLAVPKEKPRKGLGSKSLVML